MIQNRLGDVSSLIQIELGLLTFNNLLLVRIHKPEEIIAKCLFQGCNKRYQIESRPLESVVLKHHRSRKNIGQLDHMFKALQHENFVKSKKGFIFIKF